MAFSLSGNSYKTILAAGLLIIACALAGVLIFMDKKNTEPISKNFEELATASGLKALFYRDDRLPYINYSMWFPKAGADYDFPNRSGLAFLTAELLPQGAGGMSAEEIQERLNYYGTSLETSTQRQWTEISLSGLSWHAGDLWELFAKIISKANMDSKELDLLRKNYLEKRLHNLDEPEFAAWEAWRRNAFSGHGSVGEPEEGTSDSLSKISLEEVKRFYSNRYEGGAPYLIVAGQFSEGLKRRALAFLEENFKGPAEKKPEPLQIKEEASFAFLSKKNQVQSQIIMGCPLFPFPSENPRDFVAMSLANAILGGGLSFESRLMKKLREEMGLTYGVSSHLALGASYGLFAVSGATKTKTTGDFLEAASEILREFWEKGIAPEELATAKTYMKSRHMKKTETPEGQLDRFFHYVYYLGADASFLENYIEIVESVSLEEANAAVKKIIRPEKLQTLVYGHPSIKPQLEALQEKGFPAVQERAFEDYFSGLNSSGFDSSGK